MPRYRLCDNEGNPLPGSPHYPLCDDEGCPHFGTPHVCISRPVSYRPDPGYIRSTPILAPGSWRSTFWLVLAAVVLGLLFFLS